MDVISVSVIALIATVFCVILKKHTPEYAMILNVLTCVLIFGIILSKISPATDQIRNLLLSSGLSSEYGVILFKTLGVCFVTQFAADCCNDAGESALASKIELSGKFTIILIALPLFEKITSTATKLINP